MMKVKFRIYKYLNPFRLEGNYRYENGISTNCILNNLNPKAMRDDNRSLLKIKEYENLIEQEEAKLIKNQKYLYER